jgi:hypothetical protein
VRRGNSIAGIRNAVECLIERFLDFFRVLYGALTVHQFDQPKLANILDYTPHVGLKSWQQPANDPTNNFRHHRGNTMMFSAAPSAGRIENQSAASASVQSSR